MKVKYEIRLTNVIVKRWQKNFTQYTQPADYVRSIAPMAGIRAKQMGDIDENQLQ